MKIFYLSKGTQDERIDLILAGLMRGFTSLRNDHNGAYFDHPAIGRTYVLAEDIQAMVDQGLIEFQREQ